MVKISCRSGVKGQHKMKFMVRLGAAGILGGLGFGEEQSIWSSVSTQKSLVPKEKDWQASGL